jgi:neutral ceramidase
MTLRPLAAIGMLVALVAFVASPLACSGAKPAPAAAAPVPVPGGDDGYLAAAETIDITPPLHLSLFGHGPEARVATGVRLRLRCEAFVLASRGEVVALVPCDLQSSSMSLVDGVVKKLAESGVPIGADRLFLMATHTHAGPAHYFEARHYSGPFSSQIPGYDQKVVDFLANRIAAGVAGAFARLAPACLGWNVEQLAGFTFNRSYVPFLSNAPTADETSPSSASPLAHAKSAERGARLHAGGADAGSFANAGPEDAVDPSLFTLRVEGRKGDACDGSVTAALAVFGMHPTGAPNTNELYHGDIFGFAVRTAEACLSRRAGDAGGTGDASAAAGACDATPGDGRIVVGLANGIEGDVSPKLDFQSMPQARKLGRALGKEIVSLVAKTPVMEPRGELRSRYWDLDFAGASYDGSDAHRLCDPGELGMAAAGGARDGPTRVRILPEANAGYHPAEKYGCHGWKVPLRAAFASKDFDFPRTAPIALLRIGRGFLATAPGEMTTVTGARVRAALRAHLDARDAPIAIVGLTNQYMQYFATAEEYDFQYYEGASTLYGPHSAEFLRYHFACLADDFVGRPNGCTLQKAKIGVVRPLVASPEPKVTRWPSEESVDFVQTDPVVVCPRRSDGALGWEMQIQPLPLLFTADRGKFSVQVIDEAGVVDDDRGSSIEVREVERRDGGERRWRIRWMPDWDESDPRWGKFFRLQIQGTVRLTSRPFRLDPSGVRAEGCP